MQPIATRFPRLAKFSMPRSRGGVLGAWATRTIRKRMVGAAVGLVGFTGLEIFGTTVEAIGCGDGAGVDVIEDVKYGGDAVGMCMLRWRRWRWNS